MSHGFSPLLILVAAVTLDGCGSNPTGPAYDLVIPTTWAAAVTNQYFPLVRGTTKQFRKQTTAGVETITTEVLPATRLVNGVSATVVRDRVFLNGALIEDTFDWYAQDVAGNVWYLGEDTKEIVNGVPVNTNGAWEWGVNGALPGIYMWADPAAQVAKAYRQEYAKGVAEDWGKVIGVGRSAAVPFGSFTGCVTTEDWVGLEPAQPHANKTYCPQIGLVLEALTVGGGERVELISKTP